MINKYCTILDISQCSCYKNINARLLYLHLACSVDVSTYTYATSIRRLSADIGMTVATVRHALSSLEQAGLITTTQVAPHSTTQVATHIHLVRHNELQGVSNTSCDTLNDTSCHTHKNNNNQKAYTHSHACAKAKEWVGLLSAELQISADQADRLCVDFLRRMELKGKAWESEGDCLAHLISWSEKAVPLSRRQPLPRKSVRQMDNEAREGEYQRIREEEKAISEQEKAWEEVCYTWQSYLDRKKRLGEEKARGALEFYQAKRQEYEQKFGKRINQ